jgi:uncharacterized protein (DUF2236 family)
MKTDRRGSLDRAADTARRVNAERLMILGWARAILLQLSHPLIAAGVSEHSSFRSGPFAAAMRLHHTVRAMLALTFGSDAAREETLERIRAIHRRVHGHLAVAVGRYDAGTPYTAEDPDLLLWVHATLLDSIPLVYEKVIGPLTMTERDAYCAAAAGVAEALGARAADVPRTWAALATYRDAMYASGNLSVSPQARELASAVLMPPLAILIGPIARINRLVTIGLLPSHFREQYGFAWSDKHERRLNTAIHMLRIARRGVPRYLAQWPDARRTSAVTRDMAHEARA